MLTEIKKYIAQIYAGPQTGGLRAGVELHDDKGSTIGTLGFVEGAAVPNNLSGTVTGSLPMTCYGAVIDMLRYEKPVYLVINGSHVTIETLAEPVGEGEPAGASRVVKFPL